ncbi:hypothetical protein JOM56_001542 [Amanita muscaria]
MPIVQDLNEVNAAAAAQQAKKAAMEKAGPESGPERRRCQQGEPPQRGGVPVKATPPKVKEKVKEKSHGSIFLLSSPPPPTKAKRTRSDDSENEPVDIPIPSAPKKVHKTCLTNRDASDSEDSDSGRSVSDSDSTLSPVREVDSANIFDDGAATAREGGIRLDEAALTAFARRVLAERPLWAATQAEPDAMNINMNAAYPVYNRGLFSDDEEADAESPTASLSSNKENLPPPVLTPTPTPSPPDPPAAPPTTPTSDVNNTNTRWPYLNPFVL